MAPQILANPHTSGRWSADADAVVDGDGHQVLNAADPDLAAFLAAAPKMARALTAVLNLDLGSEAERLVRAEIGYALA
jgi:L-asparaginase II